MVSHPETGSDSPIGSDRDRGRDTYLQRNVHYSQECLPCVTQRTSLISE